MFSTSQLVLRNALIWLVALISLSIIVGVARYEYKADRARVGAWTRLEGIMLPETSAALSKDPQLRELYSSIVKAAADTSRELGSRYDLRSLTDASSLLDDHFQEISTPASKLSRRGLFDFLHPGKSSDNGTTNAGSNPLTSAISSALGGIGDGILQDLDGAAFFLGTGVGSGTAQGFNLSSATNANDVAAQVATNNNMKNTGLNPAIQNLGRSLSATLTGSVNLSSMMGSTTSQIQPAVLALAQGIGNGTSMGLKLTQANLSPPTGSNLSDIAGTLGFGLSSVLASNVNTSALTSQATSNIDISSLALSLAEGIGNGTSIGLGLSNAAPDPPTGSSAADIAGNFGLGLSKSLASNVNVSSIAGQTKSSTSNLAQYIVPAASGLGKGLGEGIPIGLGIRSNVVGSTSNTSNLSMADTVSTATESFAKGLTSTFLANGTLTKLTANMGGSLSSMLSTSSINVGAVVQGAVRGLVQGAGDAAVSVGGISAIIAGNASLSNVVIPNDTISFNDSVGGAATGLGQGLGGQGVLVAIQLLQPGAAQELAASTNSSSTRRSVHRSLDKRDVTLIERDTAALNFSGLNLSALVTSSALSSITQEGVDALTCEGVGGIFSIGFGLVKSGTIKTDGLNTTAATQLTSQLSATTITVNNSGNIYEISTQDLSVVVNGIPIKRFITLLAVHIVFAVIAFAVVVPAVVSLEVAKEICTMAGRPDLLRKSPKLVDIMWSAGFAPLSVIVLILGIVAMGNGGHFRTTHGIIGLLTFILGIATVALHFINKHDQAVKNADVIGERIPEVTGRFTITLARATSITKNILLQAALVDVITGFDDLATISLCLVDVLPLSVGVIAGITISGVANTTMGVLLIKFLLGRKRKDTAVLKGAYPPDKVEQIQITAPTKEAA